jgi:hypothetical protein
MSLAAKLPYDHPYAGGFSGIGSQPLPTDADAIDYLSRMATADGAGVETGVAVAVDAFFKDAKESGVLSSIRASCVLAGARTLAGALVPLKNEGPELWAEQTPTINDADGSAAEWNASTRTMSNTAPTTAIIRPRFDFHVGFENGKQYRLSGRLSGDLASIRGGAFKMGNTGSNIVFDPITGLFDSTGTVSGVIFPLLITFDGSLGPFSVTIESISIREVIDDPINSPVGNGFTSGDFSRTAGLTGDGTSYIDSGRANDADAFSDKHLAVYATNASTGVNEMWIGITDGSYGTRVYKQSNDVYFTYDGRTFAYTPGHTQAGLTGLVGLKRESSSSFSAYLDGTEVSKNEGESSFGPYNHFVFTHNNSGASPTSTSTSTFAFYSIGESLSLEDLDTAVTNLIARLKFALLVGENPSGLDPDTIDYIVRGYEAGGSLE